MIAAGCFTAAYAGLCREVTRGLPAVLDPYAAESPDDSFAVVSEAFFADPDRINRVISRYLSITQSAFPAGPAGTSAAVIHHDDPALKDGACRMPPGRR